MRTYSKGQVVMDKEEGEYVIVMHYVQDGDERLIRVGIPRCGETEVLSLSRIRPLTKKEKGD